MANLNIPNFTRLLAVAFICCCLACTPSRRFYLGGIQVNEPEMEPWISSLREAGMNTVAVTVYATQGRWDSADLRFPRENDGLLAEIREAKRQGLTVVFILRTALDHAHPENAFLWHGMIQPKTEGELANWFITYRQFVQHWAQIAEAEKVDILGIGSELNSMTSTTPLTELPPLLSYYLDANQQQQRIATINQLFPEATDQRLWARGPKKFVEPLNRLQSESEAHSRWAHQLCNNSLSSCLTDLNERRNALQSEWKETISLARKHFSKRLLYAANFDQFHEVGFWSDLDIVGVNAYFPLRKAADQRPTTELLEDSWREIFNTFQQILPRDKHKPIMFTELGYTFRRHATLEPWSSEGFSLVTSQLGEPKLVFWKEQPIDYNERRAALQALLSVHREFPGLLQGILYWKLSTDSSHSLIEPFVHIIGDSSDAQFTEVLRKFSHSN